MDHTDQTSTLPVSLDTPQADRKAYSTPVLVDFGSFAEITQGASGTAATDNVIYS